MTIASLAAYYLSDYLYRMRPMKYGFIVSTVIAAMGLGLSANTLAATDSTNGQSNMQAQSIADKNKATGQAFLAANKKKQGVVTLADGLQYKVLEEGKGAKPSATDTVTVDYAGKLVNGTEFDSSYKRGEPASFPVNAVIPGWVEALQLMPVGSTWELYIPSELAYGESGAGDAIGPNETLIFKVHLIGIK